METRLLHIIDEFKIGGAQTHLVTMLKEALKSYPNIDHIVLSLFGTGPISEQLKELGIEVEILNLGKEVEDKRFLKPTGEIEQYIRNINPDLVEAHLTWSRLLGLFAAWKAGVPKRIGFEQGDIYMNSIPMRLLNFGGQFLADKTIVCSHALKEWVHKTHGVFKHKMEVFHNCVDTAKFDALAPIDHTEIRKQNDAGVLFCAVGTLGRGVNKRADISIKAIHEARRRGADVGLVICGDGDQRNELEKLTRKLGITSSVIFLGMRNDIPDILRSCDSFCHAAPFEPFGIVCLEAMSTGLPVIIPDTGGMKEAVREGLDGFIYESLNVKSMSDKIVALVDMSEEQRQQMGKNARQHVLEHFTVQKYVRDLYEIYSII